MYQLTRKESLVIFPRERRGKKARYPLLQAGVISDPRWSSLGEVRGTRVKIEREVPRMCELCKEVLHYLCVLTIPFGERIQCSTIFAPSSLSVFLFLLHSLSPVLFFLRSDPVGLETRANFTFRCRSRFFVRPKFLILFLMKSTRCIRQGYFVRCYQVYDEAQDTSRFQGVVDFFRQNQNTLVFVRYFFFTVLSVKHFSYLVSIC